MNQPTDPPTPNYDRAESERLVRAFLTRHPECDNRAVTAEELLRLLLADEDARDAAQRRADDLQTELDWLRDQVERVGYRDFHRPPPVGKWTWDQESGSWERR